MKTTIEISDALLVKARRRAESQGLTLRAVVEQGLRRVLSEPQAEGFRLRRATFKGSGLQAGVREGDWSLLRDLTYEGRGA